MGRLPPEKLLQESFLEQLDTLQALDQLAPLTAAKEHLPGDVIDILECLGKETTFPLISYTILQISVQIDITQRYEKQLP